MNSAAIATVILFQFVLAAEPSATERPDAKALLATLKQVGREGAGHAGAQAAFRKLATLDAEKLPELLAALDDAGPLPANWIRSAIDTIAARQLSAGGKLPTEQIEAFLRDRSHAPRARRLAFELLVSADPKAADRLIPGMLDDPSVELRRDAVAQLLDQSRAAGARGETEAAGKTLEQALGAARDLDQIKSAAEELKKLGLKLDLPKQLGFITQWKVIGPFDNTAGKGFAEAFPPEKSIDLAASYEGKAGAALRWQAAESTDDFGNLDLNRALGTQKDVVGYAYAELTSNRRQPAELRIGSDNALRLWVNGKLVTDAEVYHSFTSFDQYVGRATLEPGVNRILVKVCQNAQTEEWAGDWKFQLRVCDATGGAILSEERK